MPADSFEKNNLGWQLQQLQQRWEEWWELQTSQISPPSLPEVDSPMLWIITKTAFWAIIAGLLLWIAWQMWQLLRPYIYSLRKQGSQLADKQTKTPTELSVAAWLQRSQKFQQQGNYREACHCLYMAMLQRLNDTGIAPHKPSRTDGEYLQLIQQQPKPKPYQILLLTHQQLSFSNAEATRNVFEECQQAYRETERP